MEIWELVNRRGECSGVLYDRESGKEFPEGLYFRVVEVWVRVGERLLVTRRHPGKWRGLCWEVPGGGVVYGELPLESACRELAEETGIVAEASELELLGTSFHGAAMIYSYYLGLESEPMLALQASEVVDYRYVHLDEVESVGELTPGTRHRLAAYGDRLRELFSGKKRNT